MRRSTGVILCAAFLLSESALAQQPPPQPRGVWLAALLWAVIALMGYGLAAYWPGFGMA